MFQALNAVAKSFTPFEAIPRNAKDDALIRNFADFEATDVIANIV